MISADFYPTQQTQFTVEYTDAINNLTYDDPETIAAPYYMGYVPWENVPTMMHMSKYTVVTDVGEAYVEFTDITKPENVPWFFTGGYSSSPYSTSGIGVYIVDEDTNKYVFPSTSANYYNYGFFNSLEIQRVGSYGRYMLYISGNVINTSVTPPTYQTFTRLPLTYNGNTTLTWEQFQQFLRGDIDLLTPLFNLPNESFTITADDLVSGYCEKDFTNGNGSVQIYLTDFDSPYNARDYQPNQTLSNWSRQNATFMLHADIDGDIKPFISNTYGWHTGYSDEQFININNTTTLAHHREGYSGTALGGFNGRIPYTFFTLAATNRYYVFGNFIIWRYTNSQSRLARIIPLSDVYNYFSPLATRISLNNTGSIAGYGFGDTIVYPLFNDDNSPKWEYVTGAQVDIQDELQEWQYTNITANTFTEDDIPEYEPPSPPDEDEESGDRIPNQFRYFSGATNFITQYALTRTQLGQFGTKLWTSWADSLGDPTDMWKNFKIFIGGGDTGSIDIGTVLSFIVSLKVFPFDLSAYLGQTEPSIKIGTGNYPIEVADVWKLLSTVTYIDCGTVFVPRKFNDFRDYTNVTVSCYFPYCGTVQLNAGDVVGKTLHAWYAVDLQSGECLAVLESYDDTGMLYNVASISGSMGALIPITATNSGQIMAQRISDAANVAGFFVGNVTRGADIFSSGMLSKKKSARRQSAMISGIADAISGQLDDIGDLANQGMSMLARGAIECPSMSGGSGLAAFMTPDSPYIQLRYGIYSEPNNYSHSVGRVSTSSNPIGNYKGSGYIVCENVDTSGLTCHNDEKAAIAAALETGVFV